MTIGESIKQLLEERKRLILPGFGNLEVKESAGGIPSSSARIDPPGLMIRFDSSFSKDDGLLAETWSQAGGVGREEAEQQVLELVDAIRFALDKGESYSLVNAGVFSRDDEGKVYFQPDPSWVLDEDQYGLGTMDLLELEDLPLDEVETLDLSASLDEPEGEREFEPDRGPILELSEDEDIKEEEAPEEESTPKPVAKLVKSQSPRPLSKRISTPQGPMENQKSSKRSALWRVIWIVAGILIVVLVILLMIPSDRGGAAGDQVQTRQPQAGPAVQPDVSIQEDPSGETEQPIGAPELTDEDVTAPEELIVIEEDVNHFFLIAGSFRNLTNASELQDKLNLMGYHAEVMITENRMYRVSVGSFPSMVEAERRLASLKTEAGMESVWLLSNE